MAVLLVAGVVSAQTLPMPDIRSVPANLSDVTMYVDPAFGSDSNVYSNLCQGPSIFACASPQAAIDTIPKLVRTLYYVKLAAGDYYAPGTFTCTGSHTTSCVQATLNINGFVPDPGAALRVSSGYGAASADAGAGLGSFTSSAPELIIEGTMVGDAAAQGQTATAGSLSNGLATVTVAGQTWTVNQFAGEFIKLTGGGGFAAQFVPPAPDNNLYVIVSNTATQITFLDDFTVGMASNPAAGTSFNVVKPGSVIHSTTLANTSAGPSAGNAALSVSNISSNGDPYEVWAYNHGPGGFLKMRYLKFTAPDSVAFAAQSINAYPRFYGCQFTSSGQSAFWAHTAGVDLIKSYVTTSAMTTGFGAMQLMDVHGQTTIESSYVAGNGSSCAGVAFETGGVAYIQGSWITTSSLPAVSAIGVGYVRMIGNNYVTSTSGAGVSARRGSQIRIGGVLANATGNSGTFGVSCSQTGAVFISASTTATGTTGNASNDGTNATTYATIRGNSPPTIFSTTEGCYVGQE